MNVVPPCHCDAPNYECQRSPGGHMIGRLWELCHGISCSAELSEKYRRAWDEFTASGATVGRPKIKLIGARTRQRRSYSTILMTTPPP